MSSEGKTGQGVGARLPRKEDSRHLHGRGSFVPDMILPGQREVAFWRSPVAHARIKALRRPAGLEGSIFFREDMPEVKAIVAPSTLPSFKLSEQHHLAHGKVRFVGEPIACCVGRTRAEAEDLAEQVEVDFEELPALVDAHKARQEKQILVHEEWGDNLYLTLQLDNGFEAESMSLPSSQGGVFSDSSASGGQGLLIWSNGTASKTVSTASPQVLSVRARGDQCNGAPQMTVTVDGQTVLTQQVGSSSWSDYPAAIRSATEAQNAIENCPSTTDFGDCFAASGSPISFQPGSGSPTVTSSTSSALMPCWRASARMPSSDAWL